MKDKEFYNEYYDKIKKVELNVLGTICEVIEHINEQSEEPIVEHMPSRIKKEKSVKEKLQLAGYEPTAENAVKVLSDVVGIRLVVHFIGDIYVIRNLLVNSGRFNVIKEKDYIRKSKSTGYRGYHIIVEETLDDFKLRVEIQIRTVAMDCWASLEHRIRYKKGVKSTALINTELRKCADDLLSADIAMEQIWGMVKQETESIEDIDDFYADAMSCVNG